jgi:hypothetical protein
MAAPRTAKRRLFASSSVWVGLAGLTFAVFGFLVAFAAMENVILRSIAMVPEAVPYLVALATFLVGGISWWLVVERPARPTRERGILVGALTGLFTHPLMWFLIFAYQDPSTYFDPSELLTQQAGSDLFGGILLFTFFSLLTVGPITVVVGIFGGLVLTAGRRRTVRRKPENGESAFFRLNAVLFGWILVLGIFFGQLLGWRGILLVLVAGVISTVVTIVALGWLPAVRAYLTQMASDASTSSPRGLTGKRFIVPYCASLTEFAGLYFLLSLGYVLFADELFYSVFPESPERADLLMLSGYPVLVIGVSLPVVLAANYRRNRWNPSTSTLRPVVEWSAFLILTVTIYTLAWVGWLLSSPINLLD